MNSGDEGDTAREGALVKLYQELTGASESAARAVYMHVCSKEDSDAKSNEAEEIGALAEQPLAAMAAGSSDAESDSWAHAAVPAAVQT